MAWAVGLPAQAITPSVYEQRDAYRSALGHLHAGRSAEFRRLRDSLDDYALAPYLDYHHVNSRLSSVSDGEMHAFQERHGDLPVAAIVHFRWLKHLGARRQWQRLLDNQRPTTDAELRCYQVRALYASGEREAALSQVGELWTVGRSQPKACDPLFEAWIDAGQLTEGRVWERLQLAVAAGQTRLARYLLRFLEGPLSRSARSLYEVHVDPAKITSGNAYAADDPYTRSVIAHGLNRLSGRDPQAAAKAWQRYQDTHTFTADETRDIGERITLALARQGEFPSHRDDSVSEGFAVAMAEAALKSENWPQLLYWLERLPEQHRTELRWQYWLARALTQTHVGSERARLTYQALADARNYYGFLAAQQIGQTPRLNPAPQRDDPVLLAQIKAVPGFVRALELYAVGDLINARREWYALLPQLDTAQQYHAARLAQQIGWVAQSISTANQAQLHDNLELRFPIVYPEDFQRISHATTVPKPFLLAVARQESAFDPRARSPANARGLMQLMPPTANMVAGRLGVASPTVTDLYDPRLNIELGGHHLASLLNRYDHNRPLAAAAYNAGEGRVNRWLRSSNGQPMDVWIENIPFSETRNYVKNVLAFTQVYAQLLNSPVPMLEAPTSTVN
jgi:soluble lytic murein transglycosylase